MRFEFHSLSDPGRVRNNNEDAVACEPGLGLALLADGMGGYNAGEIASAMAIATLRTELTGWMAREAQPAPLATATQALQHATTQANTAILHAAQNNPHYEGMGTTLVLGLFQATRALIGHIGDSRCYRWRDGQLVALTRDHSLLQEQIDAGLLTPEEAQYAPNRNLVTRALGVEPDVMIELHEHEVRGGDVYLLCSDGLNDMLSDADMAALLATGGGATARAARLLLEAANAAGGRDNISLILVGAEGGTPSRRGLLSRWFAPGR